MTSFVSIHKRTSPIGTFRIPPSAIDGKGFRVQNASPLKITPTEGMLSMTDYSEIRVDASECGSASHHFFVLVGESASLVRVAVLGDTLVTPEEESVFSELVSDPSPTDAQFTSLGYRIHQKQRVVDQNEDFNTVRDVTLDGKNECITEVPKDKKTYSFSDGTSVVFVGPKTPKAVCVYRPKMAPTVIPIQDDLHGPRYGDVYGGVSWNSTAQKLLYVAEAARPKSEVYKKTKDPFAHKATQSWGEALTDYSLGRVFCLDVEEGTVSEVQLPFQDSMSYGQPAWDPVGSSFVCTRWHTTPRLGLIHCQNRASDVVHVCNGTTRHISNSFETAYHPMVIPQHEGMRVVFFATPERKGATPHMGVLLVLSALFLRKGDIYILQEINVLEDQYWTVDTRVKPMVHKNMLYLPCVAGATRGVHRISLGNEPSVIYTSPQGSIHIWDILNDHMLISRSTLLTPETFSVEDVKALHGMHEFNLMGPDALEFAKEDGSYIHARPRGDTCEGLILILHGGPHSLAMINYSAIVTFLVKAGFAVLIVNYAGSLGFSTDELMGRVGELDVDSTMDILNQFLDHNPLMASLPLFVCGGSHGGYLVLQLISDEKFKSKFCAGSTRNPVSDLVSMLGTSDIPDWCIHEGVGTRFNSNVVESSTLDVLRSRSPLYSLGEASTPLLVAIGESDKRVPPNQGRLAVDVLNRNGTPCCLLEFPENGHDLGSICAEQEYWMATVTWFRMFSKK